MADTTSAESKQVLMQ